jgi:glutaredoxin-like YruB-family protein
MKTVKIYTTPTCHFCNMAKEYFKANNVPFEAVDVASDLEARKSMVEMTGQLGVPVIVVGDTDVIVGFDQPKVASLLGLPA